jgi:hypothetical protein
MRIVIGHRYWWSVVLEEKFSDTDRRYTHDVVAETLSGAIELACNLVRSETGILTYDVVQVTRLRAE